MQHDHGACANDGATATAWVAVAQQTAWGAALRGCVGGSRHHTTATAAVEWWAKQTEVGAMATDGRSGRGWIGGAVQWG